MTSESSGCLKQGGSEVALAAVRAVEQIQCQQWDRMVVAAHRSICGELSHIDFTDVFMVGWEGAFPGAEKPV